jgi:hypothetical protein
MSRRAGSAAALLTPRGRRSVGAAHVSPTRLSTLLKSRLARARG